MRVYPRRELRAARTQQGSLADLAAKTGYSTSYLSDLESGKKNASPEAIQVICQALGKSPRELFRQETIRALRLARTYYPEYVNIIDKELEVIANV